MDVRRSRHTWLVSVMSPWEASLMRLQSLLVWENPVQSAAFSIVVHTAFWYISLCRYTTIFLVSIVFICITAMDMWRGVIWPEIKVPTDSDNDEPWTPLHPRLLNIQEIADLILNIHGGLVSSLERLILYRKDKRVSFFVSCASFWLVMAYIGTRISGRLLVYLIVTVSLILPSILYHQLSSRLLSILTPLLHQFIPSAPPPEDAPAHQEDELNESAFNPNTSKWSEIVDRELDGLDEPSELDSLHNLVFKGLSTRLDQSSSSEKKPSNIDSSFEFINL